MQMILEDMNFQSLAIALGAVLGVLFCVATAEGHPAKSDGGSASGDAQTPLKSQQCSDAT